MDAETLTLEDLSALSRIRFNAHDSVTNTRIWIVDYSDCSITDLCRIQSKLAHIWAIGADTSRSTEAFRICSTEGKSTYYFPHTATR